LEHSSTRSAKSEARRIRLHWRGCAIRWSASFAVAVTLILDGGLATELERAGFDLAHPLWSERLLRERPVQPMDLRAQISVDKLS
jgi:S-methylmethionine-dependent homocysteine/selenocysteine methylase